jgi:RNA polymerase sigma-70 factor (ECF subfamily)
MNAFPLEDGELQELVRKSQEGDTEAFGVLYDRFFDSIYRYCAFRLPKEIAEDVTADIFVKSWEKLYTYKLQKGIPFGAWLFRIARYTVIDAYRTHRGFDEVSDALPDTDDFNRTEGRLERQETLKIVREAMNKLPNRYREILLLTFVSELPHSEAARVLRMSEGGVRILKMRALRKLESLLPPEMGFHA